MKKNYLLILALLIFGVSNAQTILLSQDFSAGLPAGWTTSGTGGSWAVSSTNPLVGLTLATNSVANGYAVFNSDALGNDMVAENADLITSSFSCAGQSSVRLNFQDVFAQYATSSGTIAVSANNGPWVTVYTVGPGLAQDAINGNPNLEDIDISAQAANQANVRLRFKYQGNWDYFWVVDDVIVYAPLPFDAAVIDANIDEYTAVPLAHAQSYLPSCEVFNNGGNTVTNVSVNAKIYNGANAVVYSSTLTQASLASGATTTLTASTPFTPSSVDFYLVEFAVSIAQADGDNSNDTLYTALDITDSLYARDFFYLTGSATELNGPWFLGAGATGQLGNVFRAETNTKLVSATALFGGGFAIGNQVRANLYAMGATTPGALIASSPIFTVSALDTPVLFKEFFFPANTNLTAGTNYFISVEQYAASAANFGLYSSPLIYTPNTSFIQIGAGAWTEMVASGIGEETFVIRANMYTAPNCAITAITGGTQTACNPATNQYTKQVTVTYSNAPASGQLNVNGQTFAITSSPQTVTLTGLTAGGGNVDVLAFFTAQPTCTFSVNNVFVAPASCACSITALTAGTQTACNPATNQYTRQVTVTYTNAPSSGQLSVNGQTFAITSSPQTVTLTGLTANGLAVNVTAFFTATPTCTFTQNNLFTAPASCACSISGLAAGTQTACVNTTNQYTQQVTVTYTNAPSSGLLNVNGQTFAITSSPQTVTLTGLTSNGLAVNTTAFFTASASCTFTQNNLFTAPASCLCPTINVNVVTTNATSCSTPNGTATANASGGVGPYTYAWTPSTFGSTQTISNLPAGTYSVIATAANGCSGTGSGQVANTSGVNAVISGITQITCFGASNGIVSLNVTGGTAPITYTWSDQGFASSFSSRNNLGPGAQSVVVTDNSGCSVTLNFTITQPAQLTANLVSSQNVSCNGAANGSINMTVAGGTLPYSITWSNSASTTEDLASLSGGTYQLSVTDNKGCQAQGPSVNVVEPAALVLSLVSFEDISCFNGNDGSIVVSAVGGTTPYTFNAGGANQSNGVFNTLTANTYSVSVTDNNGCTDDLIQILTQPSAALSVVLDSFSNVSCNNAADGFISVTASGSNAPFTYTINGGAPQFSGLFENLDAGSYTVQAIDNEGCTASLTQAISEPAVLNLTMSSTDASPGASNGTATVGIAGGTSPYTTSWNDAASQSTLTATNLPTGTYVVSVVDAEGCSATNSVFVDVVGAIKDLALQDFKLFPNPTSKNVTISFSLLSAKDFKVSIIDALGTRILTDAQNASASYSNTIDISHLAAGIYFVEISSEDGVAVKKLTITK